MKIIIAGGKILTKLFLLLMVSFFVAGLFFSLVSTSLIASDRLNTNSYYFFIKHFIFILLGLFIMFVFSLIEEDYLIKISIITFALSFLLLIISSIIGVELKVLKDG